MKKLLFLLFPVFSYGQITVTRVSLSGTFVGGGSHVTSQSFTMDAGKLYITFVGCSNAGGTPATASISGTGQTWTELWTSGGAVNASSHKRIQAFIFAPSSTNSNATSISYSGTADGTFVETYVATGCVVTGTNGADAIVQAAGGQSNSANPSSTLGALQSRAAVLFAVINDANPFTGTPESGWTEGTDNGYASPTTGGYIMYRTNTTDNTPTVTAASSNWAGFVIELRASGRRVSVIN